LELVIEDLSIRRGSRLLVESLSARIVPGERWAVIGPNGAGKTSLLLCLAGLLAPSSGRVLVESEVVHKVSAGVRSRWIGWLSTASPNDFGLTAYERIALAGRDETRVASAITKHEIGHLAGSMLSRLSAGERQRVELAALESRDVAFWLLDEPSTYLDLRFQRRLIRCLIDASRAGRAVISSSHDLFQAAAFATHAFLVDGRGRVDAGPVDEILEPERLEAVYDVPIRVERGRDGKWTHLAPDFAGVGHAEDELMNEEERYRQRMQKHKKVVDERIAAATEDRGVIVVLTGRGKGKSSSAYGMVARSLGHGMRCGIVGFIKGTYATGEDAFFRMQDGVEMYTMGEGFTWETQDRERDLAAAAAALDKTRTFLSDSGLDLVVLDEVNVALRKGLIELPPLLKALASRPAAQHVVLTGRNAPQGLIDMADTVSEIQPVKHAFQAGVKAQRGIEL